MKAKIILFIPYLYDGGAERVCSIWANNLVEKYNVTVLVLKRLPIEYELDRNVNIECLIPRGKISRFRQIFLLRKYLKVNQIDVIIPFLPVPSIIAHFAVKGISTKIIHNIRCNPFNDPSNKLKRFVRDLCIKKDKMLIVQNEEQLCYFDKFKINKRVVYNPINNKILKEEHCYNNTLSKVILVGRLTEQKNYAMLIDAVIKLRDKGINSITFDIYGDGPQKDELNKMISDYNLDNVKLHGNSNNIFEIEKKYDVFVMCSNFEGFPNSLLEAMALGLCVISTRCPTGPASLIENGTNGILIDMNDSTKLSSELENLYNNPYLIENIGCKAQESVFEKCDNKIIKVKLNSIIDEVLNGM